MSNEKRIYLTKVYTFLNELYISEKVNMNNAWENLMEYMNIQDGVEARNLLIQWKQAGNYEF